VTVCIPTRNRARWLGDAIASVLAQTYTDFHLVISDNASTDETPAVVAAFSDPRLTYERLPHDVGMIENYNRLFRRLRTDYSLMLPDDDRLYPELLERTVATLDVHPSAGVVHCAFDQTDRAGNVVAPANNWTYGLTKDTLESGARFIRESMKYSCRICASTALVRTAAVPPELYRPGTFPPVDFDMWLRMAPDWDFAFIARPLGAYRIHGSSHSAAQGHTFELGYKPGLALIDKLLEVKLRFLEEHRDRLVSPDELRRLAYWGRRRELLNVARIETLPHRKRRATAQSLARNIRHDPGVLRDVGHWRLLGASFLGPRLVDRIRPGPAKKRAGR